MPERLRKVPVVYYLTKNHLLEHPHFIEVFVSSADGLYLRDVMDRLVALRGKRMTTMYSWSCKRSYKNGFVWQDLSEDDPIHPANGSEYILKGSEIIDQSPRDWRWLNTNNPERELPCHPKTQEASPLLATRWGNSSGSSPELVASPSSGRFSKLNGCSDASTQTDNHRPPTRRSINAAGDTSEPESEISTAIHSLPTKTMTPPPLDAFSPRTSDTLRSLIRADISRMNRLKILDEGSFAPTRAKLKVTSLLMQLVTCGATSDKNELSFDMPSNSPSTANSLDRHLATGGSRFRQKEYFSGSMVETKAHHDNGQEIGVHMKRSLSHGEGRDCEPQALGEVKDEEISHSIRLKCIPRSMKIISLNPLKGSSPTIPVAEGRRSSSGLGPSRGSAGSSVRLQSFKEGKNDNLFRIEERLSSGARVIIQSSAANADYYQSSYSC